MFSVGCTKIAECFDQAPTKPIKPFGWKGAAGCAQPFAMGLMYPIPPFLWAGIFCLLIVGILRSLGLI